MKIPETTIDNDENYNIDPEQLLNLKKRQKIQEQSEPIQKEQTERIDMVERLVTKYGNKKKAYKKNKNSIHHLKFKKSKPI